MLPMVQAFADSPKRKILIDPRSLSWLLARRSSYWKQSLGCIGSTEMFAPAHEQQSLESVNARESVFISDTTEKWRVDSTWSRTTIGKGTNISTQLARRTNDLNQHADTRTRERDLGPGILPEVAISSLSHPVTIHLQHGQKSQKMPCLGPPPRKDGSSALVQSMSSGQRGSTPAPSGVLKERNPMYAACASCHLQAFGPAR